MKNASSLLRRRLRRLNPSHLSVHNSYVVCMYPEGLRTIFFVVAIHEKCVKKVVSWFTTSICHWHSGLVYIHTCATYAYQNTIYFVTFSPLPLLYRFKAAISQHLRPNQDQVTLMLVFGKVSTSHFVLHSAYGICFRLKFFYFSNSLGVDNSFLVERLISEWIWKNPAYR